MDWRTALYVIIALVYVGYPMYLIVSHPSRMNTRLLGLGLAVYGALALFWPGLDNGWIVVVGAFMVVFGFGVYTNVVDRRFLWLLIMAYCLILLAWVEPLDPLVTLVSAVVLVIGFDRCMNDVLPPDDA